VSRRFVSEHAGAYPVTRLCELVGVPRSSYYEWANRPLSEHYLDDVLLSNEIFDIHVASRHTYGAPRVAGQLHNRGRHHGCKRVARIMAECGLVGVHGRKKWRRGSVTPHPRAICWTAISAPSVPTSGGSRTSRSSGAAMASSISPASKTSATSASRAGR
jgi:hypothetical protein